jgi:hypothetical protein
VRFNGESDEVELILYFNISLSSRFTTKSDESRLTLFYLFVQVRFTAK